ncbi:hypothetical protein QEJ31_07940 [Pigmentibacter sp. JX0631]|uniref:hypothetical protein n=1 Tax=Pigmentibacter sp. JX0631 TaxID=2976982 RepID=UPI00246835C6|nr:hypothetical protein [Pigmentibacter sp. JX0631]WGL61520.1 hypothetical protein QEJ31_07940 [Pigmentibacter sp. JX0631]
MKKFFLVAFLGLSNTVSYALNQVNQIKKEEFYQTMNSSVESIDDSIIQNFYLNYIHNTQEKNVVETNIFCPDLSYCTVATKNNNEALNSTYFIEGYYQVKSNLFVFKVLEENAYKSEVRYYQIRN